MASSGVGLGWRLRPPGENEMTENLTVSQLTRHFRIVTVAGAAGAISLIGFRVLIELGLASAGALFILGSPLEYAWLVWYLALLAVTLRSRRASLEAALRVTVYQMWLGIAALAGTMWLARELAVGGLIGSASWVYWFAAAGAIAVFFSAAAIDRTADIRLRANLLTDAARTAAAPMTWACVLAGVVLMSGGPRSAESPTGPDAFRRWYLRQEAATVPPAWQTSPVTLVELVDYQCPLCREAARRYETVIQQAGVKYGDAFSYLRVDFPLENECNPSSGLPRAGGLHPAACEAAAAVRLAKLAGTELEFQIVEWLWSHQKALTPARIFDGVKSEFGLDLRAQYEQLIPQIRRDALQARQLRVVGTPTFFLNGRRLPLIPAESMEAAITMEMQRQNPSAQARDK